MSRPPGHPDNSALSTIAPHSGSSVVGILVRGMFRFRRRRDDEPSIWVAELRISDRTAKKIHSLHDIQPDDVRDAVVCVENLPFVWNDHPERGRRALITVSVSGRRRLVVLYPTDHPLGDVWNLGSVYEI